MFRKTYPGIRLISIIEPSLAATQTMANDLEPVMCWRTTVKYEAGVIEQEQGITGSLVLPGTAALAVLSHFQ
jgi:hypothetical protein